MPDITQPNPNETPEEGLAIGAQTAQMLFDRINDGTARPDDLYQMLGLLTKMPVRVEGLCFTVQAALKHMGVLCGLQSALCEAQTAELKRLSAAAAATLAAAEKIQLAARFPPIPIKTEKVVRFVYSSDGQIDGAVLVHPGA